MRAALLGALLLASALAQAQATEPCRNRDVAQGYLVADREAAQQRCSLPAAGALLTAAEEAVLTSSANTPEAQTQLMAALHALAERARREPLWGPAYAERVTTLLDKLHPEGCAEPWNVDFSELHAAVGELESCQCTFEAGVDGGLGHACYRFPQGDEPAPACTAPRTQLYDLPDWPAAARAYQVQRLGRAALIRLSQQCREIVGQRLAHAETRWRRLVKRGYVQYPWELWFSRAISNQYGNYTRCFASDASCTGEQGLDPEAWRPIFLHPGVGLGFPGFGKHDGNPSAKADIVLAVEAIGVNHYLDEFRHYLGISAIVGFQQADFARPRFGVSIHLSRYLQLGYLRGFISETASNGTIYLSVDLFSWTNSASSWFELPTR